jgi:hypothetical protein
MISDLHRTLITIQKIAERQAAANRNQTPSPMTKPIVVKKKKNLTKPTNYYIFL